MSTQFSLAYTCACAYGYAYAYTLVKTSLYAATRAMEIALLIGTQATGVLSLSLNRFKVIKIIDIEVTFTFKYTDKFCLCCSCYSTQSLITLQILLSVPKRLKWSR